jgi:hypothetical protein
MFVCMAMFDLVECSKYKNTGTIPFSLVGVGPVDLQKQFNFNNEPSLPNETPNTRPRRTRKQIQVRQL